MAEQNLNSDDKHPIIKIGDTVHRPVHHWTPAVHSLLKYLEKAGFKYSPRVLGFDEEGREVLSFIKGESGKEGWGKIVTDEGLRKFAKLLGTYHDAVSSFEPDKDAEWAYASGAPEDGQVMCHGDFGPWNIVWQGDEPIGIVDWDLVFPSSHQFDVLYALEYSAPFRDDKTALESHHFPEVPDRKHRIEVFLEAYGESPIADVASKVAEVQLQTGEHEKILAERGIQPQVDWVADGDLDEVRKRANWTKANKDLFE